MGVDLVCSSNLIHSTQGAELEKKLHELRVELKDLKYQVDFFPMFQHLFVDYSLRVILLVDGCIYNACGIVSLLSLIFSHFNVITIACSTLWIS